MNRFWVELSGENPPLATAEVSAAAEALGGLSSPVSAPSPLWAVELPDVGSARALGLRLALARRVLEPWPESELAGVDRRMSTEGSARRSAEFRVLAPSSTGPAGAILRSLAQSYIAGGGSIDLDHPQRRFFLFGKAGSEVRLAELVADVPRRSLAARRMPRLPFQRPVSLPPGLGRVAVNLARVRPGDRVADPFLGTGALLLEAGILGARLTGVDQDPAMLRGALQNLSAFGLSLETATVEDAELAGRRQASATLDAIVSDPPYGRASPSGGEPPAELVARAMRGWAPAVRPGGRIVLVTPAPAAAWDSEWVSVLDIPSRVHRSLTRRFTVFERRAELRSPGTTGSASRPPGPDTARTP